MRTRLSGPLNILCRDLASVLPIVRNSPAAPMQRIFSPFRLALYRKNTPKTVPGSRLSGFKYMDVRER